MREQVLGYIRERNLLKAGDRVAVAVSGGADSVALLRVLMELREQLGIVLHVAHFNHQLRGEESDGDESFVAELASSKGLEIFHGGGDVDEYARRENLGTEAAARDLRYRWLTLIAAMKKLDCVATAHTLDDQAETVLMKFLRGAGTKGLAGIYAEMLRGHKKTVRVVRPLLATSRAEIERYLRGLNQPWRDDHTNRDTQHMRNRIRLELLPLLERDYNPNLRGALGELAEIAQAEEEFWNTTIGVEDTGSPTPTTEIELSLFGQLHVAAQRRALKRFLEWNGLATDFHHVESLRRSALGETARVGLSGGWLATKSDCRLKLTPPADPQPSAGYVLGFSIPGEVLVPQVGATVTATLIDAASAAQSAPGSLLRASILGSELTLRNWMPGDRFRPAHTGSEKKLKELFAEKKIPAEQRPTWPVVLRGDQVVWVRGFPVAYDFAWTPGSGEAIRIEVLPIEPSAAAT